MVYVNVDWTSDTATLESVSGMVAIMSGAATSWYSQQQEVAALSSTEAEYICLFSERKETVCTWRLLLDVGLIPRHRDRTTSTD